MKLESVKMTYNPSLADDYMNRFEALRSRFDFSWQHVEDVRERAAWLDETELKRVNRKQLAEVLMEYNERLTLSEQARQHIEQLADERALVIVGGQQAGLFTGPLFVIYKAISVIQQAKKAAKLLSRPVIPLFWIAGEDHDLAEVDHTYVLSKDWQIEKLKLAGQGAAANRKPISQVNVKDAEWMHVIDRLEQSLTHTVFSADLFVKLRSFATQSETLTELFARLMAWLFADEGLVLLDSADPSLRQLEAPMMDQLVQRAEALNAQFMQGAKALTDLGYDVQVASRASDANLFYVNRTGRSLLYVEDGQLVDKAGNRFTKDKLRAIALKSPEKLSNNVLTRPLMQEYVLPVLGTVLGGSELAYWAQLKEGFHFYEMKLPIVWPRARYTLLEGTLLKWLDKFSWSFADVFERWADKRQEWLEAHDELHLDEKFLAVERSFFAQYEPLLNEVKEEYPGLLKMTDKNMQMIEKQLTYMRKQVNAAYESRHATALQQMERLYYALKPLDQPQERVYNIIAYLNKYGVDWLQALTEISVVDRPEQHHLVYL